MKILYKPTAAAILAAVVFSIQAAEKIPPATAVWGDAASAVFPAEPSARYRYRYREYYPLFWSYPVVGYDTYDSPRATGFRTAAQQKRIQLEREIRSLREAVRAQRLATEHHIGGDAS